jgi:hypothetical protein
VQKLVAVDAGQERVLVVLLLQDRQAQS